MQNWRFLGQLLNRGAIQDGWKKWRGSTVLPGIIAALAIAILLHLGALQPLENIAYSQLFQLRGATTWDDRVVVVAIDNPSLSALGRFPWSRQRYTQLLKIMTQGAASTVVMDILLPEPSPDDLELAAAMTEQGRVVLPKAWDVNGVTLQATPVLQRAALTEGHIHQHQDSDGLVRTLEPQLQNTPTLAIAAAQVYSLVREPVVLPALDRPLWLNWAGSVAGVPTYSYLDVLQDKIPPESFENKIVVVGITAAGFDALQTPFNRNPATTNVYFHATAINNLLQQNFLHIPSRRWVFLGLLVGGAALSVLLSGWSDRQQWLSLLAICLGWIVISVLLLRSNHLMPVAAPLALGGLTTAALGIQQRLREESLFQQEVDRLWKTYRQDLVVQKGATPAAEQSDGLFLQSTVALRMTQLSTLAEQFGRSQSTQAAISRSLSIGLLAADLEGWVWFCNPIAAECLSVKVGDRLQYRLIPEWFTPEQWQTGADNLLQQIPFVPQEVQRDDRWFEIRLEPLIAQPTNSDDEFDRLNLDAFDAPHLDRWGDGTSDGLLLLLEDITARKQVEDNLTQQMQELQLINQLKDDFLNTVSHDMRAPLTNMKMAIRMLQISNTDEQRQRYLQVLERECSRETNLIEDLLSLQQLEAGAKPLELEEIDLSQWLPQLLEPFRQRAQSRQLTLNLQLPVHAPPFVCDRSSLERVIIELVNNACKYTPPEGEIRVEIDAVHDWMQFIVSNTGVEIPAAELNKIFDKFYRMASSDRWQQGGTGLGLALVKKIVEQLGGNIDVTSQFEKTTFTVQVPTRQRSGGAIAPSNIQ
jgi:signal transduction histidine kinase/CHASE2 domain-containing sensor protein